jgi:hypothetical protein
VALEMSVRVPMSTPDPKLYMAQSFLGGYQTVTIENPLQWSLARANSILMESLRDRLRLNLLILFCFEQVGKTGHCSKGA